MAENKTQSTTARAKRVDTKVLGRLIKLSHKGNRQVTR